MQRTPSVTGLGFFLCKNKFYARISPMITLKEIEKLADLSRIKLDDSEKEGITKDVDSILAYVDQIKEATVNMDYTPVPGAVYNAFRDDTTITTSPESREAILNEAPDREGDFVAVKKIIAQD
ncbi:MAG: aspartyl-tRNA(Asn)/glutamyl-tRNA(Gln) amidotransferase subunit [Patescibacteria group bacterium]|nr:aspartyl-tRNA(Asn)/glutamyl-tRNA(Gln) amidotransferase subunit [Patescibacteria group bacterium]